MMFVIPVRKSRLRENSVLRLTGSFGSVALKSSSGFIRGQLEWSLKGIFCPLPRPQASASHLYHLKTSLWPPCLALGPSMKVSEGTGSERWQTWARDLDLV